MCKRVNRFNPQQQQCARRTRVRCASSGRTVYVSAFRFCFRGVRSRLLRSRIQVEYTAAGFRDSREIAENRRLRRCKAQRYCATPRGSLDREGEKPAVAEAEAHKPRATLNAPCVRSRSQSISDLSIATTSRRRSPRGMVTVTWSPISQPRMASPTGE